MSLLFGARLWYTGGRIGDKDMKLPRKWSKIGHSLLLVGVIGLFLELLFWIPNMEVGWKNIAAVVWMVVSMVLAFGGAAICSGNANVRTAADGARRRGRGRRMRSGSVRVVAPGWNMMIHKQCSR